MSHPKYIARDLILLAHAEWKAPSSNVIVWGDPEELEVADVRHFSKITSHTAAVRLLKSVVMDRSRSVMWRFVVSSSRGLGTRIMLGNRQDFDAK